MKEIIENKGAGRLLILAATLVVIGLYVEVLNVWFVIGMLVGGILLMAEYTYNKYLYLKKQEDEEKIKEEKYIKYMRLKNYGYLPLVDNYEIDSVKQLTNVIKRIIAGNANTLINEEYRLYISLDILLLSGIEIDSHIFGYKVRTSNKMEDGYIAFIPK